MKLSPAQQQVLKWLDEGYIIRSYGKVQKGWEVAWLVLRAEGTQDDMRLPLHTFKALLKRQVLKEIGTDTDKRGYIEATYTKGDTSNEKAPVDTNAGQISLAGQPQKNSRTHRRQ